MMMLDLNGLKYINDTLGHEAGDRMIFNFSAILRNTLPSSSVICRWGGDEFAVMLTGMSREKMERYMDTIHRAVDVYHANNGDPPIFFAVGYALSTENPSLSRKELLAIANNQMHLDKQKWYVSHDRWSVDTQKSE